MLAGTREPGAGDSEVVLCYHPNNLSKTDIYRDAALLLTLSDVYGCYSIN